MSAQSIPSVTRYFVSLLQLSHITLQLDCCQDQNNKYERNSYSLLLCTKVEFHGQKNSKQQLVLVDWQRKSALSWHACAHSCLNRTIYIAWERSLTANFGNALRYSWRSISTSLALKKSLTTASSFIALCNCVSSPKFQTTFTRLILRSL